MSNKNNLKKAVLKALGNNTQTRNLKDIPTTIGMPQGRNYTVPELIQLYKMFGRYSIDNNQPYNSYYGAPQYVLSAPQWLLNRDNVTQNGGYNYIYPNLPDNLPTNNGNYVIRNGVQPY